MLSRLKTSAVDFVMYGGGAVALSACTKTGEALSAGGIGTCLVLVGSIALLWRAG